MAESSTISTLSSGGCSSFLETAFCKVVKATSPPRIGFARTTETTIDNECYKNASACMRMLLKGPSQSGKTSIAMDLAYSIASGLYESEREEKDGDHNHHAQQQQHDQDKYCAVTYLIPLSKRDELNFPLRCYTECDCEEIDNDANPANQMNEDENFLDDALLEGGEFLERRGGTDPKKQRRVQTSWNDSDDSDKAASILQRINVKYIQSCEELIQYLASIQSLPPLKRPSKGIIVDDIDRYIRCNDDEMNFHDDGDGSVRLLFQENDSSNISPYEREARKQLSTSTSLSTKDASNMETMRLLNLRKSTKYLSSCLFNLHL